MSSLFAFCSASNCLFVVDRPANMSFFNYLISFFRPSPTSSAATTTSTHWSSPSSRQNNNNHNNTSTSTSTSSQQQNNIKTKLNGESKFIRSPNTKLIVF